MSCWYVPLLPDYAQTRFRDQTPGVSETDRKKEPESGWSTSAETKPTKTLNDFNNCGRKFVVFVFSHQQTWCNLNLLQTEQKEKSFRKQVCAQSQTVTDLKRGHFVSADVWTLPPPGTVTMESVDMRHTLTWRPPQAPCNTTVLYSVQFQGWVGRCRGVVVPSGTSSAAASHHVPLV